MIAADTHVHLLAGYDDGPRNLDEAMAMARRLVADGARHATALAHQNDDWPRNTPDHITEGTAAFQAALRTAGVPLTVYPTGEVVLGPDVLERLQSGQLQTIGGHGKHLLVEMPYHQFFDPRPLCAAFTALGVRLVIAHAERYPELLHDSALTEKLIAAGCLIQVTTDAVAIPRDASEERALKDWFTRGIVHLLGSDGHNLDRRPIRLGAGIERIRQWAGPATVDRIAGIWGIAVLQGQSIHPPPPRAQARTFFARLLGG